MRQPTHILSLPLSLMLAFLAKLMRVLWHWWPMASWNMLMSMVMMGLGGLITSCMLYDVACILVRVGVKKKRLLLGALLKRMQYQVGRWIRWQCVSVSSTLNWACTMAPADKIFLLNFGMKSTDCSFK